MKVGIMQPYLFPYVGYWQLINAVDIFVLLDDVNYIKRGFINRNNILINNKKYMFSISVEKASQNKLIKDMQFKMDNKEKESFLKAIKMSYGKAPFYDAVYPIIQKIIMFEEKNITSYIENSIKVILNYLGIEKKIIRSSELEKNNLCNGEERILEICHCLRADVYINPIGGVELYHQEKFKKNEMQLYFLNANLDKNVYKQFSEEFVEGLSIIDILMFNDKSQIKAMLDNYKLSK